MQISFLNIGSHIHHFRRVYWPLGATIAGLILIITGGLAGYGEQDISASEPAPSSSPRFVTSEVRANFSERSSPSATAIREHKSADILRVNNIVQPEKVFYLSKAIYVVKKEVKNPPSEKVEHSPEVVNQPPAKVDRQPEKVAGTQTEVQASTQSERVDAPVAVKPVAPPIVVSSKANNDTSEIIAEATNNKTGTTDKPEQPSVTAVKPASADDSQHNAGDALARVSFNSPQSVATDGLNLYVADTNNHKIRMIEIATGRVDTLAGSGVKGNADGLGEAASFNHPRGVVADGFYLYVTDSGNHLIRKINLITGQVTTLAGSGETGLADKTGSEASFNSPRGIAITGKNLFVADYYNQSIRKIDIETGLVTTAFPKQEWLGSGGDKLPYFPGSIALDGDVMYVADYDNHTIRTIQLSSGKMGVLAGSGRAGAATGIGKAASFNYPCEIAIVAGALYVADSGSHTIRKIDMASSQVTKFAGSGSIGMLDGMGEKATFGTPFGLTTYGNKLYVADQGNHQIRQIDLTDRKVKTMVGSGQVAAIDSRVSESRLPKNML